MHERDLPDNTNGGWFRAHEFRAHALAWSTARSSGYQSERRAGVEALGWVSRCSGQQSQVRLRGGHRRWPEDAHQSLLAPLPLRMSTQDIKGRVVDHRLARLDQGRRLSDGCRRPEAADVDRWSTGSSWVAVACSGRCMGAAMACVHDRLRIVHPPEQLSSDKKSEAPGGENPTLGWSHTRIPESESYDRL